MFKVKIMREEGEKTYLVYNSGELVETKKLTTVYCSVSVDLQRYNVSFEIVSNGNGLSVILKHLDPVIIDEEKVLKFFSDYTLYGKGDFLPCTPISSSDYDALLSYAIYTNQLNEEFENDAQIEDDIESVKQFLKKK